LGGRDLAGRDDLPGEELDRDDPSLPDIMLSEFTRTAAAFGPDTAAKYAAAELLSKLTGRERRLIELRYGFNDDGNGLTQRDVGRHFGISAGRAQQIEHKALQRIHRHFRDCPCHDDRSIHRPSPMRTRALEGIAASKAARQEAEQVIIRAEWAAKHAAEIKRQTTDRHLQLVDRVTTSLKFHVLRLAKDAAKTGAVPSNDNIAAWAQAILSSMAPTAKVPLFVARTEDDGATSLCGLDAMIDDICRNHRLEWW